MSPDPVRPGSTGHATPPTSPNSAITRLPNCPRQRHPPHTTRPPNTAGYRFRPGVPVKVVSERLGHSTITMTLTSTRTSSPPRTATPPTPSNAPSRAPTARDEATGNDRNELRVQTRTPRLSLASHPGEHIADELAARGMTAADFARVMEVDAGRLSRLMNAQVSVTGDTAIRLAEAFGTSAEFWIRLPGD